MIVTHLHCDICSNNSKSVRAIVGVDEDDMLFVPENNDLFKKAKYHICEPCIDRVQSWLIVEKQIKEEVP